MLIFFFFCYCACQPATVPVWIDTEVRLGKPLRDVDDGLALITALRNEQLQIEGISVNGSIDYAAAIARKLVREYSDEPTINIYKGARSSKDLGKETEAVKALSQKLQEKKIVIIALGNLTNIATVVKLHPGLANQIGRIIFCGGRSKGQHFNVGNSSLNLIDANFERDPEAFNILMRMGIPFTLTGFEPAKNLLVDKKDILFFRDSDKKTDRWIYRKLRFWQWCWKLGVKTECFIPFDVVTLASFTHPDFFRFHSSASVTIHTLANDLYVPLLTRKKKLYLNVQDNKARESEPEQFRYCNNTDAKFKVFLLQKLEEAAIARLR